MAAPLKFKEYVPPQLVSRRQQKPKDAALSPGKRTQGLIAHENCDETRSTQCTIGNMDGGTNQHNMMSFDPDVLPSIEELLGINQSSTVDAEAGARKSSIFISPARSSSPTQTASTSQSNGQSQDCAIIIDGDITPDESIDGDMSPWPLDTTSLPLAKCKVDGPFSVIGMDANDEIPATEALLHEQVELDSAALHSDAADLPMHAPIGTTCSSPSTGTDIEQPTLEHDSSETRNDRIYASTTPGGDGPPTPPTDHAPALSEKDDIPPGEWEALAVIGEKIINGELHYVIDWKPTPEPMRNCEHMKELVEKWKATQAHHRNKTRVKEQPSKAQGRIKRTAEKAGSAKVRRRRGRQPNL